MVSEKVPNVRKRGSYGLQPAAEMKLMCWWCDEVIRRGATYIRQNAGEKDLLFHPACEREMRGR